MVTQVTELENRKRQLLADSDRWRQSLSTEIQDFKAVAAWVPRTIRMVRTVYPIILLAVPLLGYLVGRRRSPVLEFSAPPRKRGIFSSILAGYKFYRNAQPMWDQFRSMRR